VARPPSPPRTERTRDRCSVRSPARSSSFRFPAGPRRSSTRPFPSHSRRAPSHHRSYASLLYRVAQRLARTEQMSLSHDFVEGAWPHPRRERFGNGSPEQRPSAASGGSSFLVAPAPSPSALSHGSLPSPLRATRVTARQSTGRNRQRS